MAGNICCILFFRDDIPVVDSCTYNLERRKRKVYHGPLSVEYYTLFHYIL